MRRLCTKSSAFHSLSILSSGDHLRLILFIFRIPNELLKNGSPKFKEYLLVFLNQVLKDGVVPESLNVGKCMLVFKVIKMSGP